MSPARRAFIGALIGAFIVLFGHPASRPYLVGLFSTFGIDQRVVDASLVVEGNRLPTKISSELDASVWMLAGAERILQKRTTPADLNKLISVAKRASEIDSGNAFWGQMVSVCQFLLNDRKAALQSWIRASKGQGWDDFQSRRLSVVAEEMSPAAGPSWRWAALYTFHSTSPARVIDSYARYLVRTYPPDTPNGSRIRFAVLANARLLRTGSRNLGVFSIGETMIELSSFPPEMESQPTPKKLLLARQDLVHTLRQAGMELEADEAEAAFADNEAWMALTSRRNPGVIFEQLALSSIIAAGAGGLCLSVALLGLSMLGIAMLLKESVLDRFLAPPYPHILGLLVACGVYALTGLVLATVAVCLSFAFLSFGPGRTRTRPPDDLGPLFSFISTILGALLALTLALFLLGLTSPALHLGRDVGIPREYLAGSPVLAGLFVIGICLVLLVGPSWALAQRVSTASVLRRAIERIGRGLIVGGLVGAIMITPLSVYVDTQTGSALEQIVANEPIYYGNE